jgi:transcriptional regulator with XRE-family HTH domain
MARISKNLRHLRDLKNLTQQQMADKLNITKARLGSYEEGRSEPSSIMLIKLSNYFHISIDALLRGDLSKTNLDGLMKIGNNRLLFPVILDEENNEVIELISARASAGYLNGYADPEYVERLQRIQLPFLPAGKHRAFPIKGDSMPPLRDGSFVVGKYVSSFNEIKDGNTYVLLTKSEGIVYKRIQKNPKKKDILTLIPDNKAYQSYEVKTDEIFEIWEYVCSLNIGTYKAEELNIPSIMGMLRDLHVEIKTRGQGK